MKLIPLTIVCDKCSYTNKELVSEIPGYSGEILRSFWCKNTLCHAPQVVRYKFTDGTPEFVRRIEPSSVHVEHEPNTGITIRPRAKSR